MWDIGCRNPFFWLPDLVTLWGKILWYLLREMVFSCILGCIVRVMVFVYCLVISCSVLQNATWLSLALSVHRVPSFGMASVTLSNCRGAGTGSILSWLYQMGVKLHVLLCGGW